MPERQDHLSHINESEMTADQLAFRRNGYGHDVQAARMRGDAEATRDAVSKLDKCEAMLCAKLLAQGGAQHG